jgi:hypothetical protein
VEYCSLETPAKSAAPYAHQLQTNPIIFGVDFATLIVFSPPHWYAVKSSLNLAVQRFFGIVLQRYSLCGTFSVAQAITFA